MPFVSLSNRSWTWRRAVDHARWKEKFLKCAENIGKLNVIFTELCVWMRQRFIQMGKKSNADWTNLKGTVNIGRNFPRLIEVCWHRNVRRDKVPWTHQALPFSPSQRRPLTLFNNVVNRCIAPDFGSGYSCFHTISIKCSIHVSCNISYNQ